MAKSDRMQQPTQSSQQPAKLVSNQPTTEPTMTTPTTEPTMTTPATATEQPIISTEPTIAELPITEPVVITTNGHHDYASELLIKALSFPAIVDGTVSGALRKSAQANFDLAVLTGDTSWLMSGYKAKTDKTRSNTNASEQKACRRAIESIDEQIKDLEQKIPALAIQTRMVDAKLRNKVISELAALSAKKDIEVKVTATRKEITGLEDDKVAQENELKRLIASAPLTYNQRDYELLTKDRWHGKDATTLATNKILRSIEADTQAAETLLLEQDEQGVEGACAAMCELRSKIQAGIDATYDTLFKAEMEPFITRYNEEHAKK